MSNPENEPGFLSRMARRLLPNYFGVNPKDTNSDIVAGEFGRILQRNAKARRDFLFEWTEQLDLKLRNDTFLPARLKFYADNFEPDPGETDPVRLNLYLSSQKDNEYLSKREFYAAVQHPRKDKPHVLITSYSETAVGWEGNGFAFSLIKLSDQVIGFAMNHFSSWDCLPVKARITDMAKGRLFRNRTDWTENKAREIGYRETAHESDKFIKWYRK